MNGRHADVFFLKYPFLLYPSLHFFETGEGLKLMKKPEVRGAPAAEIAEMLGVSSEAFQDACTYTTIGASNRPRTACKAFGGASGDVDSSSSSSSSSGSSAVIRRPLTQPQVLESVAALVKFAYSQLFAWLVAKINVAHAASKGASVGGDDTPPPAFIGILDIFGFEIMEVNSFEQLCINYANEVLQQQFNETIFETEQTIYEAEGLDWSKISYRDNQGIIDLIAGAKPTPGLLLITEEFVRGATNNKGVYDDPNLLTKMNEAFGDAKKNSGESFYEKSRFADGKFTIRHFAGTCHVIPQPRS